MIARDAIAHALEAYAALEELGGEVEDEWQYVTDLAAAHRASLAELGSDLGEAELSGELVAALDEAIAEIGLIRDPHRAIDWLSTFPHVVALALGRPLWAEAAR